MSNTLDMNRRTFMKVTGAAVALAVTGMGFEAEAEAAAMDFVGKRQASVYAADAKVYKIRKSQDNPMVQKLYAKDGFLADGPCGHKSHELLHTYYFDRSANVKALKAKGIQLKI
ncbi:MAG: iron hydrogenase small subunit [Desulfovibrionaceae bacterium]